MPPPTRARRRPRRGFSLLEILIAVAIAAMLLVAVNFFVLSLGELWGGGSEERLFDRHVRGVARFLDSVVQQSIVPDSDSSQTQAMLPGRATASVRQAAPLATAASRQSSSWWQGARAGVVRTTLGLADRLPLSREAFVLAAATRRGFFAAGDFGGVGRLPPSVRNAGADNPPTGASAGGASGSRSTGSNLSVSTGDRFWFDTPSGYDSSAHLLTFELNEAPGQCVWPGRPLPQVVCSLLVNEDEGLVLLWKSKLEEDYGEARPRKTQLSPFARSISFDYYDSDTGKWSHSEQPQSDGNGGYTLPQRVRLGFVYQGFAREISITLPTAPGGAPLR